MTTCQNRCKREKLSVGGSYKDGGKRCVTCVIWIYGDDIFCHCCNERLRITPKVKKNIEIKRIE